MTNTFIIPIIDSKVSKNMKDINSIFTFNVIYQ